MMDAINLRELLSYNPLTGDFVWRVRPARKIQIGDVAGSLTSKSRSRRAIRISGKNYYAHRLAWLHVHGEWPLGEVDHINGNEADNRISNLRVVSHQVNMQNRRRAVSGNRAGELGVSMCAAKKPYRARLQVGNRAVWLGRHESPEAAHSAYVTAKRKYHEGCTI